MATWQADFEVVLPPSGVGESFTQQVSVLLPPARSWNDDLRLFGEEDGLCLKVWFERGVVDEVTLRVDLRTPERKLLTRLLECLRDADCKLRLETWDVIAAEPLPFFAALRSSAAFRFVEDPRDFLRQLPSSPPDDCGAPDVERGDGGPRER
jgi:hypothetical protein